MALLADEMGLGKSAQAITAADQVGARSVVVLCPAVARVNWLREFDKFSPFSRPGAVIKTRHDKPVAGGVTACSYDLAIRPDVLRELKAVAPDVLVCDESHYLKSHDAQRTKAVLGKDGLVHTAERLWCLSGTPAPNDPSEIWLLLYVMGVYKHSRDAFIKRFCTGYFDGCDFKVTGGKNYGQLRDLLGQIMLRRKKEQVMLELPPIRFTDVVVEPGEVDEEVWFPEFRISPSSRRDLAEQDQAAQAMLKLKRRSGEDLFKLLEGMAGSMPTLRRWTGLSKVGPAVEIIKNDLANGVDKIVVFAIHRDVIMALSEALRPYGAVHLYGGTPPAKRQRNIDKFQRNPKCRIFIGQVAAAGTAITLTAASDVLFVEADWVPSNNAQAAMRVHRIGQSNPVLVRFLGAAGSIDEQVQKVLRRKTETLAKLFD